MPRADSAVSSSAKRRRHRWQLGSHYLAGAIVLLKASELREHAPYALFFAAGGISILIATAVHQRLEHRFRFAHSIIHLAEGLIVGAEAYLLAEEGKHGVQYPFAFAAVLLLGAAIFTFSRERRLKAT